MTIVIDGWPGVDKPTATKALWALAAGFIFAAAMPVSAAENAAAANDGLVRKHIQVVEGPVSLNAACDMLPTGADIARAVLETLERNRSAFTTTRALDIVGRGAPLDPDAIKVLIAVQVAVGPETPSGRLAQSVETQLAFWWTPQSVAPLMGDIRTVSQQRPCDAALAKAIVVTAEEMVQRFAEAVADHQRRSAPK